jgi:hypothetical protein
MGWLTFYLGMIAGFLLGVGFMCLLGLSRERHAASQPQPVELHISLPHDKTG